MKPLTQADNSLRADAEADGNEIAIARTLQRTTEIEIAGLGLVPESVVEDSNMAFGGLGRIGFDMDDFLRVQPSLQRGHAHHRFENRARHVAVSYTHLTLP